MCRAVGSILIMELFHYFRQHRTAVTTVDNYASPVGFQNINSIRLINHIGELLALFLKRGFVSNPHRSAHSLRH